MACLRLVSLLVLSFLQLETGFIPVETRGNVTSRDAVFGKRSVVELESVQSNTCFNGGGCGHPTYQVSAACNPGAYVYKMTGYSGANLLGAYYATRFNFTCSDGVSYSIGELGSYNVTSTTIFNPNGYQAVLADGGCISDHIQIGGTDFGSTFFSSLSACTCSAGLNFVGFPTLNYMSYWPSFPTLSILCDTSCSKGSYYSNGNCYDCGQGAYSFPGSVGSGSCFGILTNVGNGGPFVLQVKGLNTFVSGIYSSPVVTESTYAPQNSSMIFMYNETSLQIVSNASGLCLDDGGREALGGSDFSATLIFTTCDSSNIDQQFIFTSGGQIYNPNWPDNKICLRGVGGELILWTCDSSSFNQTFEVLLVCPPGRNSKIRSNAV